jgi:histidinol-phosphate aminotransferase
MADATDALLIVDEAYMDFANESVIRECALRKNLMVLKTLSKSFGCAAVRVGFAVSCKENINVIKTLKSPYNLNSVSQLAGKIMLSEKALAKDRVEAIKASRDALYSELKKHEGPNLTVYPTSANFVYVKTDFASAIAEKLLQNGIVIRCFKGALRIAAGLPEENEKLFAVLKEMELL